MGKIWLVGLQNYRFEFGKLLPGKKVYQILEVLSNCIKFLILIVAKAAEKIDFFLSCKFKSLRNIG